MLNKLHQARCVTKLVFIEYFKYQYIGWLIARSKIMKRYRDKLYNIYGPRDNWWVSSLINYNQWRNCKRTRGSTCALWICFGWMIKVSFFFFFLKFHLMELKSLNYSFIIKYAYNTNILTLPPVVLILANKLYCPPLTPSFLYGFATVYSISRNCYNIRNTVTVKSCMA